MNLNDLLCKEGIDPKHVLVLRHRPVEPELRKVLPWLASEKPDFFNAYQQTQREKLEKVMNAMVGVGYVASFIGSQPGKALFVGLYTIAASRPLTYEEFWQIPAYVAMKAFGLKGWTHKDRKKKVIWFELATTSFYSSWKGKLIVGWPTPERAWWRRAHRNAFPVIAIREDSALESAMPPWNEIVLDWKELGVLPSQWKAALSEWRGIYYIVDTSDGKGYVGSAYGADNLLGRWQSYAASGHGGNRELRKRDPRDFRFSILQRVSPDMEASDVIRLEASWKQRLHTHRPHGLNDN